MPKVCKEWRVLFLNIHFLNNVNNVHSRTVKVDIRGLGPCWVNLREKYSNVQESSGSFLLGGGGLNSTGLTY